MRLHWKKAKQCTSDLNMLDLEADLILCTLGFLFTCVIIMLLLLLLLLLMIVVYFAKIILQPLGLSDCYFTVVMQVITKGALLELKGQQERCRTYTTD